MFTEMIAAMGPVPSAAINEDLQKELNKTKELSSSSIYAATKKTTTSVYERVPTD